MPKGKLKVEYITNNTERNQTFRKRQRGILKKANELSTLCGVKVCAVINRCDKPEEPPEIWPSREEAKEVHEEFKNMAPEKRVNKMYDQHRYLQERIDKQQEKLVKLHEENREIQLREAMFDLIKGKMTLPNPEYDANFIGQLNLFIGDYINKLTHRIKFLEPSGGPVPPNVDVTDASGPVSGDVNHVVVATEGSVSDPTEFYDHMHQYDGMDMSVNEQAPGGYNTHVHHQEPIQYQTPGNLYDQIQPRFYGSSQGMNMNHQEQFQYQPPPSIYDQTQPRFYGSSQDMYTGLNHDKGESSNQSFMSMLMGQPQHISDVQDLASVASMDDNNNRYHQLPVTTQMPLTTTTTATATPTTDLSDHSINNKRWPTRFGLD